mgnify:FL=1
MSDNLQVTAFIGNVFDNLPVPSASGAYYGQGNIDGQTQRVFGRTFNVSLKARF